MRVSVDRYRTWGLWMLSLTSIVAVNETGAIGAGNALPWRVRSDLRFFREQTRNNVVIMGRRTYDSLGRGLPDRLNIVVTHGFGMFAGTENCQAAGSINEALVMAEKLRSKRQEVFIVGGASMYEQFSPLVDRYLITEVKKAVLDADTYFSPEIIGDPSEWNHKIRKVGKADGDKDEADFTIFELSSKDPGTYSARRQKIFDEIMTRRLGNRLDMSSPAIRAAAG